MKRTGNLFDKIALLENLYLAFYKAKKGKQSKKEVIAYAKNLVSNLSMLQNQITSNTIEVGQYHFFKIYEPKERQICAASFNIRVLHHAVMNICHPVFEKLQIFDSYATRKGKGTYKALERAAQFNAVNKYYLKLDVRKYFDSINHSILYELLQRKFKEPKLLNIFKQIIESYQTSKGKGLPIGNLTSQYFANYYLSFADRYIQHELKINSYVRYMDDMVLWSNNKEELVLAKKKISLFLKEKLALSLKINILNTNIHGVSFLGYRIYREEIRLTKQSKKRFIKKAKEYDNKRRSNLWSEAVYQTHILPLLAFVKKAKTEKLRENIFFK